MRSLAGLVERAALIPQVKLNLHLRRDPHNSNSELFLLDGLARANHDLPCIVHSIEQHSHFRRPRSKRRGAFLDQRPKLIRRSFGLSHAAGSLIGNVSLAQRHARGRMRSAGGSNRRSRTRSPITRKADRSEAQVRRYVASSFRISEKRLINPTTTGISPTSV
jgi:hypothetical protein